MHNSWCYQWLQSILCEPWAFLQKCLHDSGLEIVTVNNWLFIMITTFICPSYVWNLYGEKKFFLMTTPWLVCYSFCFYFQNDQPVQQCRRVLIRVELIHCHSLFISLLHPRLLLFQELPVIPVHLKPSSSSLFSKTADTSCTKRPSFPYFPYFLSLQ